VIAVPGQVPWALWDEVPLYGLWTALFPLPDLKIFSPYFSLEEKYLLVNWSLSILPNPERKEASHSPSCGDMELIGPLHLAY
jgi:hypothetical protein